MLLPFKVMMIIHPFHILLVGAAYATVFAYLWAKKRWPEYAGPLQLTSLVLVGMMVLKGMHLMLVAASAAIRGLTLFEGWASMLRLMLSLDMLQQPPLSALFGVLTMNIMPVALSMLVVHLIRPVRTGAYHVKALTMILLLPAMALLSLVLLFLLILLLTFVQRGLVYADAVRDEVMYRLY